MKKEEKGLVEVMEIWMPVKSGGEAVDRNGKHFKMIALITNGKPTYLEKDFFFEKYYANKRGNNKRI